MMEIVPCCDQMEAAGLVWTSDGMAYIRDQDEDDHQVSYCPFCGTKIELRHVEAAPMDMFRPSDLTPQEAAQVKEAIDSDPMYYFMFNATKELEYLAQQLMEDARNQVPYSSLAPRESASDLMRRKEQ